MYKFTMTHYKAKIYSSSADWWMFNILLHVVHVCLGQFNNNEIKFTVLYYIDTLSLICTQNLQ